MSDMSLAEKVAAHLPYLRRFARVVTGSQKSGDAYVAMTLEALLADPTILSPGIEPRVALYRAFLRMLNSIEWNRQGDGDDGHPAGLEAAHRNLASLTPPARQAFLLMAAEEFSPEDAAVAMDVSASSCSGSSTRPAARSPASSPPTSSSSRTSR